MKNRELKVQKYKEKLKGIYVETKFDIVTDIDIERERRKERGGNLRLKKMLKIEEESS